MAKPSLLLLLLIGIVDNLVPLIGAEQDLCDQIEEAKKYCYDNEVYNLQRCSSQNVDQLLLSSMEDHVTRLSEVENAAYNFTIDQSESNLDSLLAAEQSCSEWEVKQMIELVKYDASKYNQSLARLLLKAQISDSLCDTAEIANLGEISATIMNIYSTASAEFGEPVGKLEGENDFNAALRKTDDYQLLTDIWVSWYNASGAPLRELFTKRLKLLNKGAQVNGWRDKGFFEWYTDIEDQTFDSKVLSLIDQLMPIYKQLHAYVRFKLFNATQNAGYFADKPSSPIPLSILGNLWGQQWDGVASKLKPYSDYPDADVTQQMIEQNYDPVRMFKASEEFYVSLGLPKMTDSFWNYSMISKPTDPNRTVDCHGSAWDLFINDDYRISMCTSTTMDDFATVHHEMGHVQYFMAYRPLPITYRSGANSGFHEAIGDTISLSVMTPEHLHKIGLLNQVPNATEFDINFLMTTALKILPLLPFALTVDIWRWKTFNGSIDESNYNREWWKLRTFYGGVAPPLDRNDENFFDPGAKFHVANDIPYIRYFLSHILQFQFYEAMCKAAGYSGPLHRCDFYNSKEAGAKLLAMLRLGASKPWPEALSLMTGSSDLSVSAILSYFKPLESWLIQFNCDNQVVVGWDDHASLQCSLAS